MPKNIEGGLFMSIRVISGSIKHSGKTYLPGEILTIELEEEKRLVALKVAEFIEEPKEEKPKRTKADSKKNDEEK